MRVLFNKFMFYVNVSGFFMDGQQGMGYEILAGNGN